MKSLLFFPVFMASWIPLQILALVRRTEKWEVIRHGACDGQGMISSAAASAPVGAIPAQIGK